MMTPKIQQSLIAGMAATVAMTLVMAIAPMMGFPKMSAAGMLSMMLGVPIIVGWLMHFMIGVIFATSYVFFLNDKLARIGSPWIRGAVFGMIVFVFAQIVMVMMGAIMGGMPPMEGSKGMMMLGSIIGHVIYGVVVALLVKPAIPRTA